MKAEKIENMHDGVFVYVAEIPHTMAECEIYPPQRAEEINACTHPRVKAEKTFVWELLRYAVKETFDRELRDFNFKKGNNGKWESEGFCFSLSHSKGAAAVAVSQRAVGVDIELFDPERMTALKERILTKEEIRELSDIPLQELSWLLLQKWTQKESVFKIKGEGAFIPAKITPENVSSRELVLSGRRYCLSAAWEA